MTAASELRAAVMAMAGRYATATQEWAFAVADQDLVAQVRAERGCTRRYRALLRLTQSLADLAGGE